ncbi:hypothetical protein SODALDRAFT_334517 [Sodiomyces alkalinus F11]|uniref:RING-type E3 ubiquitin transferase n=1 Tax=Sodiomyces alkalinus (strain CBS 110278 / VKM F-3762 / F11) TaxID=1314773 RepID=A0A3N2PSF4_SODAK|nr:hypothetical protein SODALDRAFT_334517 [Sodiomyces alkalinus F11]ROT37418.1 hypothetical protein SODALDRAFT_334517 [Sodiomyces alkalinus F11]
MASPGEGAGQSTEALGDQRHYIELSSDSESSSEGESVASISLDVCRWRTARFHDQECSRFFDCPSHLVERHLSDDEVEPAHAVAGVVSPRHGGLSPGDEVEHDGTAQDTAITGSEGSSPVDRVSMPATSLTETPRRRQESPREASIEAISWQLQEVFQASHTSRAANLRTPVVDLTGDSPSPPTTMTDWRPTAGRENQTQMDRSQQTEGSEGGPSFVLPRWQPDAEVTVCPICRTQFSFFVRKHHCRKCGRVVCNRCSPHRITIPNQFIVRPPDQLGVSDQRYAFSLLAGEGGYADLSSLGGGERVRLCNPCVPDPNPSPPGPQRAPNQASTRRTHHRSHSNAVAGPGSMPSSSRYQEYFPAGSVQDMYSARNRSVTHSGSSSGVAGPSRGTVGSTQSRFHGGAPFTYSSSSSAVYPGSGSSHSRRRSMLDSGLSSSSSPARNRALPPPPQIPEEDECPVCHRELPSRDLPDFDSLREAHITDCITSHSTRSSSGAVMAEAAGGTPPPRAHRRTGMFPYVATEKDCVDSAECTICLEEFEVGVPMARLECLCRFHRACISAWFVKNPGRCPVHQHDGFGY